MKITNQIIYSAVLLAFFFSTEVIGQNIRLTPFASGINQPVTIAHAGDDRLFVVEKPGRIRIVTSTGQLNPTPYLDIRNRVSDEENEMGLLGVAFHPQYADNGYFYVNFTDINFRTIIARYSVDPSNPDIALPATEKILFTVQQPYGNHNGGDLHFGPDGYLYIALGDGGLGGDPGNRSQNLGNLLGKMLRIDVDNGEPYGIPADNPFITNSAARDEIWSYGLRNPWRFSFDKQTGDMFIGDVGQNAWEEIDFQPANSPGGENYGWRCYEGDNHSFNLSQCNGVTDLTWPIFDYQRIYVNGCSVTGGYMYRGSNSAYDGHYLYGDYCSGRFWTLRSDGNGNWINTSIGNMPPGELAAFGEDMAGELYVAAIGEGRIYKVAFPILDGIGKIFDDPIRFWPNPFVHSIHIAGDYSNQVEFQILDIKGTVVKTLKLQPKPNGIKVDLSELSTGNYFITYQIDGQKYVDKVVRM